MAIIYLCFCIWYTTNSGANKQKQLYVFLTVCFCFRISCSVSSVLVQILLSGSHSSPDMAFLLIDIQHYPCLTGKGGIKLHKTLCHVFMYRTLAYPELLCCLPNRCLCLNNIGRDLHCPLFNILFQGKTPANIVFTMYAGEKTVIQYLAFPLTAPVLKKQTIYFISSTPHSDCPVSLSVP